MLEKWVANSSGIVSAADVDDESHWNVIINYFEGAYDAARKAKFTEIKMGCFLEIMLYLMKQLLGNRLPQD